jgi:hypothetical protein
MEPDHRHAALLPLDAAASSLLQLGMIRDRARRAMVAHVLDDFRARAA